MASLSSLLYDLRRIEAHREVLTEKKIERIYNSLMKDLNSMLADEFVEHADPNGALFYGSIEERVREARFLEEISSRVGSITPELKAEMEELCEKVYTDCYKGLYKAVTATTNGAEAAAALSTIKANPRVIRRMYENGITKLTLPPLLERHRADIVYQIKQELTIGMINGDRQDVIAKKISERLNFSMKKANNIVRTETHRNIETGMYDSATIIGDELEGSGLVMVKIWRTMKDERVRPQQRRKTKKGWKTSFSKNGADHMKMEGIAVLVDEDFQLEDNVTAKCPSQSGVARHDCNCRCFLQYKLMKKEKFESEYRHKGVAKSENSDIIKSETTSFQCKGDYLREVMGSAKDNNPDELQQMVDDVHKKGGKVDFLSGNTKMVCNIQKGQPATIEVDENISLGGFRHEYRHFLDDLADGHKGIGYYLSDKDRFFEFEKRGYEEEIRIAEQLGYTDIVKRIKRQIEERRREIYGS